eukprot:jgi/Ulvmu1/9951/UM058_0034.1
MAMEGVLEAIANATAQAIGEIVNCDTSGNANICAQSGSSANAVATAVGSVFSRSVADASSACPGAICNVSAEIVTEAIGSVLAMASQTVILEQLCISPISFFDIDAAFCQIDKELAVAISSILVRAGVANEECIFTDNNAGVIPGEVSYHYFYPQRHPSNFHNPPHNLHRSHHHHFPPHHHRSHDHHFPQHHHPSHHHNSSNNHYPHL